MDKIEGEVRLDHEDSGHARKHHRHKDYSEMLKGYGHGRGVLSSFMVQPKVSVEVQQAEEHILLITRQHPLVNLKWILLALFMMLVSLFFPLFPPYALLLPTFQFATTVLWYLLITAVVLQGFLNWYFDLFIVTDERIIDVDFKNLIYKNITSTKIDNIEDVTYSISGAIPSLLNFGNVLIQTAGTGLQLNPEKTTPSVEILNTPRPQQVVRLINEMILEEEQEKLEGRTR